MFHCYDVKMAFCFSVINSVSAIALKAINNARAEFFRKDIFNMNMVDNFGWWFENDFKFALSQSTFNIAFCSRILISNDFLSRNGKTQTNWIA